MSDPVLPPELTDEKRALITVTRKVPPVKLFDILLDDIHSMGDVPEPHVLPSTAGLTFHEVFEHLAQGGDWYFQVTKHNDPSEIYMSGYTYESMRAAYDGESCGYLGSVDDDGEAQIQEIAKRQLHQLVAAQAAYFAAHKSD